MNIPKIEIKNKKEIAIILLLSMMFICLGIFSYEEMQKLAINITHNIIPSFIFYAFLCVTLVSIGVSTYKWFPWLKQPKFSKKIFISMHFIIWLFFVLQASLLVIIYYTYYSYPNFQYGFIFDIAGIAIIIILTYFLLRIIYQTVANMRSIKQ